MSRRVELASPYGQLERAGGMCALVIRNGALGWRTGWTDLSEMQAVDFDGLRETTVGVPHHWLREVPEE